MSFPGSRKADLRRPRPSPVLSSKEEVSQGFLRLEDRTAGVCTNPYACMIAARPWSGLANEKTKVCLSCKDEQPVPFKIVKVQNFKEQVQRCPVCIWLFGQNESDVPRDLEALMPLIKDMEVGEHTCWMCGTIPHAAKNQIESIWDEKNRQDPSGELALVLLRFALEVNAEPDFINMAMEELGTSHRLQRLKRARKHLLKLGLGSNRVSAGLFRKLDLLAREIGRENQIILGPV